MIKLDLTCFLAVALTYKKQGKTMGTLNAAFTNAMASIKIETLEALQAQICDIALADLEGLAFRRQMPIDLTTGEFTGTALKIATALNVSPETISPPKLPEEPVHIHDRIAKLWLKKLPVADIANKLGVGENSVTINLKAALERVFLDRTSLHISGTGLLKTRLHASSHPAIQKRRDQHLPASWPSFSLRGTARTLVEFQSN